MMRVRTKEKTHGMILMYAWMVVVLHILDIVNTEPLIQSVPRCLGNVSSALSFWASILLNPKTKSAPASRAFSVQQRADCLLVHFFSILSPIIIIVIIIHIKRRLLWHYRHTSSSVRHPASRLSMERRTELHFKANVQQCAANQQSCHTTAAEALYSTLLEHSISYLYPCTYMHPIWCEREYWISQCARKIKHRIWKTENARTVRHCFMNVFIIHSSAMADIECCWEKNSKKSERRQLKN